MINPFERNFIITHFIFVVFAFFSIWYFIQFSSEVSNYTNYSDYQSFVSNSDSMYKNAINIHDYYIYLTYIDALETESVELSVNNNTGIALIYIFIKNIFGVELVSLPWISLIVNILVIYLCLLSFCKVVYLLGLHPNYYLLFFINGSLLYFSQLINKDSFTLLIFIKSLELILSNKTKGFYWLIPFSFLIRIQLVPFLLLFIFLNSENRPIFKFWVAYLFTAILAGLVAKFVPLISIETMDSSLGLNLNLLIMQLNQKYIVASVFLNPLRVLQYLMSLYHSLSFTNLYWLDVGKMKDLPQFFVLVVSMPFIIKCYSQYRYYINFPSKTLMAQVSAFFMVWLINPTTSGRYLLVLIPTISLLAVYIYESNFNKDRE